jgi:phthalate 4,5-dioxygenase
MLTPQENELLCRIGPAAPMGRMFRRYWVPAALSTELVAGTPKRIRLLGESFVAFRGGDGIAGVLDEACPHRGASLVLARGEGCALRCLFHGWKIDRSGAVLETPAEPEDSAFAGKVRTVAARVHEAAGIVWAYLGPPEAVPPVPDFAFARVSESRRVNAKHRIDCNWTQCLEGAIDSSHSNYLHSADIRPKGGAARTVRTVAGSERPSQDGRPRLAAEDTPYGFRYAALRRPLVDPELQQYVRVTHFVAPATAIIPLGDLQNVQIFVPIDDEHTYMYNVKCSSGAPLDEGARRPSAVGTPDDDFGTDRTRANLWMQDRTAMQSGSFSGIAGIRNQDTAMQESMGALYDRSKEHLGTSDVAIIRMRRRMLDSLRAFTEGGEPPLGLGPAFDYGEIVAVEGMLPLDRPWQQLLAAGTPA